MKYFQIALATCGVLFLNQCTPLLHHQTTAALPDATTQPDTTKIPPPPVRDTSPPPKTVPVTQWVDRYFFVLHKQKLVRGFGYEIYSCKKKACDKVKPDTSWEYANHRIKCDKLSGSLLRVTTVEPDSYEWTITLLDEVSGREFFCRTHKQALSELAFADDLSAAKRRWLNTTVFSKRGIISVIADSANTLRSERVLIQDSLQVTDVRWGMTPLPVKPIWLMVTTPHGAQGFIPIRISSTNTMASPSDDAPTPWDEDIFEQDPTKTLSWNSATWELVNNHRVVVTMTPEQVRLSWGAPRGVSHVTQDGAVYTVWMYASQELIFNDVELIEIHNR